MDSIGYVVVASVMFASGFLHGIIVKIFLDSIRVADVEQRLQDAIDRKFELDIEVDELKNKNRELENINKQIKDIMDKKPYLPPPPFKLIRHGEPKYSDSEEEMIRPLSLTPSEGSKD